MGGIINSIRGKTGEGVQPVNMTGTGPLQLKHFMAGLILIFEMGCHVPSSAVSSDLGGSVGGKVGAVPPDWVNKESPKYPRERYLTGVGYGDSRKAAEDEAYAAISRIFQANIQSKAQEWEQYLQSSIPGGDSKGGPQISRRIWIDQLTQVSTEKVLENVSVAEVWVDPLAQRTYALGVMERIPSAGVIKGRIEELDHQARALFESATKAGPPDRPGQGGSRLQTIRDLHGAFKALLLREGLNTDLMIISPTGQGVDAPIPITEVGQLLRQSLSKNFNLALKITGSYSDRIRSALLQGLTREGFVLIDPSDAGRGGIVAPGSPPQAEGEEETREDILIQGGMELDPVQLQGRPFFRWRIQFSLIDRSNERIFGNVTRSGREGHLNAAEAEARAVRDAQRVVEKEVGPALAGIIYGTVSD